MLQENDDIRETAHHRSMAPADGACSVTGTDRPTAKTTRQPPIKGDYGKCLTNTSQHCTGH